MDEIKFIDSPECVRNEHIDEFVNLLRATDKEQGKGELCTILAVDEHGDPTEVAYCCLGLGSKHINLSENVLLNEDDEATFPGQIGFDGITGLAPVAFAQWLGIAGEGDNSEVDPRLDVRGAGLLLLQRVKAAHITALADLNSLATLNDNGFTFPQIGDMIAYFGLLKV